MHGCLDVYFSRGRQPDGEPERWARIGAGWGGSPSGACSSDIPSEGPGPIGRCFAADRAIPDRRDATRKSRWPLTRTIDERRPGASRVRRTFAPASRIRSSPGRTGPSPSQTRTCPWRRGKAERPSKLEAVRRSSHIPAKVKDPIPDPGWTIETNTGRSVSMGPILSLPMTKFDPSRSRSVSRSSKLLPVGAARSFRPTSSEAIVGTRADRPSEQISGISFRTRNRHVAFRL